jgi:hypothetical protein
VFDFVTISLLHNFSRAMSDAVRDWAKRSSPVRSTLFRLPCYKKMMRDLDKLPVSDRLPAHFQERIEIAVPPHYNNGDPTVTFDFMNVMAAVALIMTSPFLISRRHHFKWAPDRSTAADGSRKYTPQANSGLWYVICIIAC